MPLGSDEIDRRTVLSVVHTPEVRAKREQAFPGLQWQSQHRGNGMIQCNWYEVHLPETAENTLSVRCSLRVSYGEFVQELFDRFGWLAFR